VKPPSRRGAKMPESAIQKLKERMMGNKYTLGHNK